MNYLKQLIKLISYIILVIFTFACQQTDGKGVLKKTIETTNRVKNLKSLTKDGVREEIYNNTKRAIEQMGR